ncbi:MAG: NAD-dependent epimerase/dehydratase family protein [Bacteroidetes bacterium]|nr:NAD-dependent epimerase/dehydratase family protein [Bacteroidota bacterium]
MAYQSYYKDKIILITGGAGAIGRNLALALSILQAKKVILLDNLSSAYSWNIPNKQNILFVKGDIRNEDDLVRVFHHKPTLVFHLAAFLQIKTLSITLYSAMK